MSKRDFSKPDPRVDLAFERTRLAAERTLMAWIRTSIALIGFGFSIYKFFDYLHAMPNSRSPAAGHASRNLGLALIALGTLAMAGAVAEYMATVRKLGETSFRISLAFIVGILMIVLGVFAFIGVLLGTGPF
ncbi:MAG: DUF202 domain-containing protein [Armatimonadota bacterium]|nr:DUF202 domain-containing protein [Armatimonadota bacterium]